MNKKYLDIKEIQKEELNILKETINFLNENSIKYYIFYGTLLGAVRHNGFIPWDDDIDIIIPRPEYEKLINILKNKNNKINGKNIEAIGYEVGVSDWPFIKIVNKDIKLEDELNCDEKLWIDVFPLDGASDKENKHYKKVLKLRNLYWFMRYDIKKIPIGKVNGIRKILKKIILFFYKIYGYNRVIESYIKCCKQYDYNKSEYITDNIWGDGKLIFKKSLLEDKSMEFDELEVNGVKNYDEMLTIMYGDYKKLPPEEERVSHSIKAYRK